MGKYDRLKDFRGSKDLMNKILDNVPISITVMDYDGKFIFFNKQSEINLGVSSKDLRSKSLTDLLPKEGPANLKIIRNIFEDKQPVNQNVVYTIHGKTRYFKIERMPQFDALGNVSSVLSLAQETTELVQNQKLAKIQLSIDSLQSIGETFEESLQILFDNLFQLDWIDAGGLYLVNYEKEVLELVYHRGLSENFLKSVTSYPFQSPHAEVAFNRVPRYISTDYFLPDTKDNLILEKLCFVATIPLIYRGKVLGLLNLASRQVLDINESDRQAIESIALKVANLIELIKTRKELDNSNSELTTKLKELNIKQQMLIQKSRLESLGELSAGLAHEINQPLSIISLAMENINYKVAQKNATGEYLTRKFETINQNIDKIRLLIEHVRLFSRDQGTIMFEQVNVNNVITSALSMIGSQLRYHHIDVCTQFSKIDGYTIGNPSRLEQVILNLLSNSRDAVEEKSKRPGIAGYKMEIRIKTAVEHNKIAIKVRDNGVGISKENLARLFNPFFTTKSAQHGTGLGLPIVYGIVREMQGEIKTRSKIGSFTEVSILLPLYENNVEKN